MLIKILSGIGLLLVAFLAFVSTRPSRFRYERSGVLNASADKIYPYLSNFKLGSEWSPYERIDLSMKKNYIGADGAVGSKMEFDGNSKAGSGNLEILKLVPNQLVEIRLIMTKPFGADNLIEYKLTPEGNGTRFTWSMSGDSGFMGKLMGVLIDCEKMVGDQFVSGIDNLKKIVEK